MYQSGYLESDLWLEGFIDPHVWYIKLGPPDIQSGSYDQSSLTITAHGDNFYLYPGVNGKLYYRKHEDSWVEIPIIIVWNNAQIIGKIFSNLEIGYYDLKVIRDDLQEDVLLNAFLVAPPGPSVYYVDAEAVSGGDGTESSPWNILQLKSYFKSDPGYFPINGDIINVKGNIAAETLNPYTFLVSNVGNITIIIQAWNKTIHGMFTVTMPKSGVNLFQIAPESFNVTLDIRDLVILPQWISGPGASPLSIIKSLGGSTGIHHIILRNCMILSDYDVYMSSGPENVKIDIYGSNISLKDAKLYINAFSNSLNIYDSVVNLQGSASIHDNGSHLNWNHCEFNKNSSFIPGVKNECTFENIKLNEMPTSIWPEYFNENDFNYWIYNISNAGNGTAFWLANNISLDIRGGIRRGIGAFRFDAYNYYVDGEKTVSGDGSESNPFTFNQFRNYFCDSLGDPCNVSPTGYDTFYMKNIFTPIDNFFIKIHKNIGGYVIIKCHNIGTNKAWLIETKECL